jgi:hypothetical protein
LACGIFISKKCLVILKEIRIQTSRLRHEQNYMSVTEVLEGEGNTAVQSVQWGRERRACVSIGDSSRGAGKR